MSQYLKFAAQVGATILAAIVAAISGDNAISPAEGIHIATLALGAVAVLGAGNLPAGVWSHTKTIVSAAAAGTVFLESAVTGGISGTEWLMCALAVLGAIGVHAVAGPKVIDAATAGRHAAGLADGPA